METELLLDKNGLNIQKKNKEIIIDYCGDLTLNLSGSINLNITGELNLLSHNSINIDAIKDDTTNFPITLNSRCNSNIKNLDSSIKFRKNAKEKQIKATEKVNNILKNDGLSINKLLEDHQNNNFKIIPR